MVDGATFMREQLAAIATLERPPREFVAAFDLDNTLFDSRARTLAAAKAFDVVSGTSHFAELTLDTVGVDARRTCAEVGGVPAATARNFEAFWRATFWDPDRFVLDPPLEPMLPWVGAVRDAGANVRFVTGRVALYEDASLAQLHRAGLNFATAEHLRMKPGVEIDTIEHKRAALEELTRTSTALWYVTESRREISSLQRLLPTFPLVLLDCSLERDGPAVAPDTPTLPRVF